MNQPQPLDPRFDQPIQKQFMQNLVELLKLLNIKNQDNTPDTKIQTSINTIIQNNRTCVAHWLKSVPMDFNDRIQLGQQLNLKPILQRLLTGYHSHIALNHIEFDLKRQRDIERIENQYYLHHALNRDINHDFELEPVDTYAQMAYQIEKMVLQQYLQVPVHN